MKYGPTAASGWKPFQNAVLLERGIVGIKIDTHMHCPLAYRD
jgi:hypothetical protein